MMVELAAELQVIVTMPSLRVSLALSPSLIASRRFIHRTKLLVSSFLILNYFGMILTVYQCGILEFKGFE